MMRPEELQERIEPVGPWQIRITSYRLGSEWLCVVDNVDPGAVLSRNQGKTREETEFVAVREAKKKLSRTRILDE